MFGVLGSGNLRLGRAGVRPVHSFFPARPGRAFSGPSGPHWRAGPPAVRGRSALAAADPGRQPDADADRRPTPRAGPSPPAHRAASGSPSGASPRRVSVETSYPTRSRSRARPDQRPLCDDGRLGAEGGRPGTWPRPSRTARRRGRPRAGTSPPSGSRAEVEAEADPRPQDVARLVLGVGPRARAAAPAAPRRRRPSSRRSGAAPAVAPGPGYDADLVTEVAAPVPPGPRGTRPRRGRTGRPGTLRSRPGRCRSRPRPPARDRCHAAKSAEPVAADAAGEPDRGAGREVAVLSAGGGAASRWRRGRAGRGGGRARHGRAAVAAVAPDGPAREREPAGLVGGERDHLAARERVEHAEPQPGENGDLTAQRVHRRHRPVRLVGDVEPGHPFERGDGEDPRPTPPGPEW